MHTMRKYLLIETKEKIRQFTNYKLKSLVYWTMGQWIEL